MVHYTSREAADSAIASMNGVTLSESAKPLQVRYADSKKRAQGIISAAPATNEVKLFVGNLPVTITPEELTAWFAPYGNIVETFIFPRGSVAGKCGFVRLENEQSAASAISALHGQNVGGSSSLVVRVADSVGKSKAKSPWGGSSNSAAGATAALPFPVFSAPPRANPAASPELVQLLQLRGQLDALIGRFSSGSASGPMRSALPTALPGRFRPY
jgi:CUG-BP- and ETR3-like factor